MYSHEFSNYCLFYMKIDALTLHHTLSQFYTFHITDLPLNYLTYLQYEVKKQLPLNQKYKDKNIKNEFEVIVIKDDNICFFYTKQKVGANKESHMALCDHDTCQLMFDQKLVGDSSKVVFERKILKKSFLWQNFIISYCQFQKDTNLLILQQIFSSPSCDISGRQLSRKNRNIFHPLLSFVFSDRKAEQQIKKYQFIINGAIQFHKEMVKEIDRQKEQYEINYSLIFYYSFYNLLSGISTNTENNRSKETLNLKNDGK